MKVTLIIAALIVLAALPVAGDAGALAADLSAATDRALQAQEPAILLVFGAALLVVASVVRRYVR